MSYGSPGNFPNYGSTSGTLGSSPSLRGKQDAGIYHQLCDAISSNIFAINNNSSAVDRGVRQLGTKSDTPLLRDKIHETLQTTNETIGTTTRFLKDLSVMVRGGDKQQRLQFERLKNEFQDTFQRYTTLQKQVMTKIKYTYATPPQQTQHTSSGWVEDEERNDEKLSLIDEEKRIQKQRQLDADLEMEQALLEEREQRINQIQSDMLDVNTIMKELASLVNEQGDTINTIEGNIERVTANVSEGREQLSRASNYQKKVRQKLCIFILILVVVAAALGVVIWISVK